MGAMKGANTQVNDAAFEMGGIKGRKGDGRRQAGKRRRIQLVHSL